MATGKVDPTSAVARVLGGGAKLSPTEIGAAVDHLRGIRNRSGEVAAMIGQTDDPIRLGALNEELSSLAKQEEDFQRAGDLTGNEWHQVGQALQVALKPDYSMASLMARAKASLMGTVEGIPEAVQKKLADMSGKLAEADKQMADLKTQLVDALKARATKVQSLGARDKNLKAVRAYFGVPGGDMAVSGGIASKRAGAARYTIGKQDADAMRGVRALAKEAAVNGATDINGVLDYVRKEAGINASDDHLLRLLSDDYRSHMIEADVARRQADRYLRDIQSAAAYKLKTPVQKAFSVVGDLFTTTQRGMRAGLDLSAPFIQGRKALTYRHASEWAQAWKPMLKAMKDGDVVAMEHLADVKGDPMYSRFVASGGELTEPGGAFTHQEEQFAGNFTRQVGEKIPGLKYYFKGLEYSDAAFAVFLNKLRYDVWKKLAMVAPEDPAYLRDIADQVNVMFGRGTGKIAKQLGGLPGIGNVVNAPRYTVSQFQYALLQPAIAARTGAGRMQALHQYAAQAMTYGTILGLAKLAGWDVDTDPRSTNFGKAVGKDGSTWDVWGKEEQPVRLAAQLLYGKATMTGKYSKPSVFNSANVVGMYLKGKAQPGLAMGIDSVYGKYDGETGKTAPMTPNDYLLSFSPYWVEQVLRDKTYTKAPVQVPASFVGMDVSGPNPRVQKSKAPPLDLRKPGTYAK